jgi:4-hydroxybenzoate polyprenyltransferase
MIKKIINLYLYSSLHIGICAGLLTLVTYQAVNGPIDYNYCIFIAASTSFLYSVHRLIGEKKYLQDPIINKYLVVRSYNIHLQIFALVYLLISIFYFLKIIQLLDFSLVIAIIVSLLYVFPLFSGKRRLRDFDMVKIFLVAIVWAILTCYIPVSHIYNDYSSILGLSIERAFYIFAITIPFDIRDTNYEKDLNIKTIPSSIGNKGSKIFSAVLLTISAMILVYFTSNFIISFELMLCFMLTYMISFFLIIFSSVQKPDWYFIGLLDGTMLLPFILLNILNKI